MAIYNEEKRYWQLTCKNESFHNVTTHVYVGGELLKSIIDGDLHIVLDVEKSSKNSRYNRNKITGLGNSSWLTIPWVKLKKKRKH